MIIILSPSKDMSPRNCGKIRGTAPLYMSESNTIINKLQKLSVSDIEKLMKVSGKLANINYDRIINLASKDTEGTHAISTYTGDVYIGLDAANINPSDLQKYQDNIFILSALYGILRPLDIIKPYRLEMQTSPFSIGPATNLYQYWSNHIIEYLVAKLGDKMLINLASDEYSKVVLSGITKTQVINISFREMKNGKPAFVSTFAKKARGLMARYAIIHKIKNPTKLKEFNLEGYQFAKELSTENDWFFTR